MLRQLLASLALTAIPLHSRSPLTTTFGGGETGSTSYFELTCTTPAGVTVSSFDVNLASPAGTTGTLAVHVKCNGSTPIDSTNWAEVADAFFTSAGVGTPTPCVLNTGIQLGPGQTLGFALDAGSLLQAFTPPAAGLPTTFSTSELTWSNGLASSAPFLGTPLNGRIANIRIHYTIGGAATRPACATRFGQGCGGLELTPLIRPFLGTPPFTFRVSTRNVPPPPPNALQWHVGMIGFGNQALPLAPLGMAGCQWLVQTDDYQLSPPLLGGPVSWFPVGILGIPNVPGLIGCRMYCQSGIVQTTLNQAFGVGAIASNGLELVIGI